VDFESLFKELIGSNTTAVLVYYSKTQKY